jgi:hypothetical protein
MVTSGLTWQAGDHDAALIVDVTPHVACPPCWPDWLCTTTDIAATYAVAAGLGFSSTNAGPSRRAESAIASMSAAIVRR